MGSYDWSLGQIFRKLPKGQGIDGTGHRIQEKWATGLQLTMGLIPFTCHNTDQKSRGSSLMGSTSAISFLFGHMFCSTGVCITFIGRQVFQQVGQRDVPLQPHILPGSAGTAELCSPFRFPGQHGAHCRRAACHQGVKWPFHGLWLSPDPLWRAVGPESFKGALAAPKPWQYMSSVWGREALSSIQPPVGPACTPCCAGPLLGGCWLASGPLFQP